MRKTSSADGPAERSVGGADDDPAYWTNCDRSRSATTPFSDRFSFPPGPCHQALPISVTPFFVAAGRTPPVWQGTRDVRAAGTVKSHIPRVDVADEPRRVLGQPLSVGLIILQERNWHLSNLLS